MYRWGKDVHAGQGFLPEVAILQGSNNSQIHTRSPLIEVDVGRWVSHGYVWMAGAGLAQDSFLNHLCSGPGTPGAASRPGPPAP